MLVRPQISIRERRFTGVDTPVTIGMFCRQQPPYNWTLTARMLCNRVKNCMLDCQELDTLSAYSVVLPITAAGVSRNCSACWGLCTEFRMQTSMRPHTSTHVHATSFSAERSVCMTCCQRQHAACCAFAGRSVRPNSKQSTRGHPPRLPY